MANYDVTDEMHDRAVKLCRQFMGESWANISKADMSIDRVKGGLSNEIYHCSLSPDVSSSQLPGLVHTHTHVYTHTHTHTHTHIVLCALAYLGGVGTQF